MSKMFIFVGNVGTGKSLIASKLAKQGALVINIDTIQSMLSGGAYGRYDPFLEELYYNIETTAIETALSKYRDIVIDRSNMNKEHRVRFVEMGNKYNAEIICCHFGIGKKSECIKNRMKTPRGISEKTWTSVYDLMAKNYDQPICEEGFSSIVEMPKKYKSYSFNFDGTIVTNEFPGIGKPIRDTVNTMQKLSEKLSNIIIVSSCRSGESHYQMVEFLNRENIFFDTINYNPIFETGSRKMFADVYYDDRNFVKKNGVVVT